MRGAAGTRAPGTRRFEKNARNLQSGLKGRIAVRSHSAEVLEISHLMCLRGQSTLRTL